ncbi:MAG: HEAT repeat domain-containing protein, partial [Bacteroidota bacterium]
APKEDQPAGPSLYRMIAGQAGTYPGRPIRYDDFPPLVANKEEDIFSPGARDIFTKREEMDADQVIAAVKAMRRHIIRDWRTLEANLATTQPPLDSQHLIAELSKHHFDPRVRRLLREVLHHSRDHTAVKWAIVILTIDASPALMDELMVLARHSEFTIYVCLGLLREAAYDSTHVARFTSLISVTEGWGLYQVLSLMKFRPDLLADRRIEREMIIHGVRNCNEAGSDITALLLSRMSIPERFADAETDEELAAALLLMLQTYLTTEEEPGPLAKLPNGEVLLTHELALIEKLPSRIEALHALMGIGLELSKESFPWERRLEHLERARALFFGKLDADVLADAIRNDDLRWGALNIISEVRLTDLLPVVMEDFRKRPDPMNIDVLGSLGEGEHLRAIFALLPDTDELERRSRVQSTEQITGEMHEESVIYAVIIKHLGKMESPDAMARIKQAARDVHPRVRWAAVAAMTGVQRWTLDAECREIIRLALDDPFEMVKTVARQTAAYHNLNASINGAAGITGDNMGISLN